MARGTPQVVAGTFLATAGLFLLVAGLARTEAVPDLGTVPGWQVAVVLGFILLLTGVLAVIFSIPKDAEPQPTVTATEAFHAKKKPQGPIAPEPAAETMAAFAERRLPAPSAPLDPKRLALFRLEEEIRDLTRRINKAGVMLATGQLSQQGYSHYVDDLKRERGRLEASRVDLELKTKP